MYAEKNLRQAQIWLFTIVALVTTSVTGQTEYGHPVESCWDGKGSQIFGEAPKQVARWNQLLLHVLRNEGMLVDTSIRQLDNEGVITKINEFKQVNGYLLNFYLSGTGLPDSLPRIESYDAPCDTEYTVFVRSLRPNDDLAPLFELDLVYEVDTTGKVLNEWRIPINKVVLRINGSELFIQEWISTICAPDSLGINILCWLAISSQGEFRSVTPKPDSPTSRFLEGECPPNELFIGSAYKGCWVFKDTITGAGRILIYQGPCA